MLTLDKNKVTEDFVKSLGPHEIKRYETIRGERQRIYFTGFSLGIILSLGSLLLLPLLRGNRNGNVIMKFISKLGFKMRNMNSIAKMCFTTSITFITTYYYYILSKKSDYMILHLEEKSKRKEWLKVYKAMQRNCHTGFALGMIGVAFLSVAL